MHRCFKGPRDVSLKDWTPFEYYDDAEFVDSFGSPKRKCGALSSLLHVPLWDEHDAGLKESYQKRYD